MLVSEIQPGRTYITRGGHEYRVTAVGPVVVKYTIVKPKGTDDELNGVIDEFAKRVIGVLPSGK